ncbi:hypothetical protein D1AOALGA4SA_11659 [Olavius algarvensis Delta 1 endosymbiont]|nr:hypothetical protein D1AOALGA4SA_11659 [Olavius algarvensis Delta 1 endosymbiont]
MKISKFVMFFLTVLLGFAVAGSVNAIPIPTLDLDFRVANVDSWGAGTTDYTDSSGLRIIAGQSGGGSTPTVDPVITHTPDFGLGVGPANDPGIDPKLEDRESLLFFRLEFLPFDPTEIWLSDVKDTEFEVQVRYVDSTAASGFELFQGDADQETFFVNLLDPLFDRKGGTEEVRSVNVRARPNETEDLYVAGLRGAVPEPSTMLLLGLGLIGLTGFGRKKLLKK